jgi:hypothetical protein
MNNTLTPAEREVARYALGLNKARTHSKRNADRVHVESEAADIWRGLISRGLARENSEPCGPGMLSVSLTSAGALAALDEGKTLDEEDFQK